MEATRIPQRRRGESNKSRISGAMAVGRVSRISQVCVVENGSDLG